MGKSYYKNIEEKIFAEFDRKFFGDMIQPDEKMISDGIEYYLQAVELIKKKSYDEAGKFFEKSAKCGNVDGQYNYGITLMNGEGCEPNPLQGSYWYWKAAQKGHDRAMVNLAINYRKGDGVLQNGVAMIYWYAKAAHELNPHGVYNLGLSLKQEEVITGNRSLGYSLISASDELEEEDVAMYVKKVTAAIIAVLEGDET